MRRTRKITYSAVGAAISSLCVCLTNFGWLKVSLLMVAALCYYLIAVKCGILYALADIAISLLLAFLIFGVTIFSYAFLADAVLFAPYAILCYFIRKLYYNNWKTILIRIAVVTAFSCLAFCGLWFCAKLIFFSDMMDIRGWAAAVKGYAVLNIIFVAFALSFDFLFYQLAVRVAKYIK